MKIKTLKLANNVFCICIRSSFLGRKDLGFTKISIVLEIQITRAINWDSLVNAFRAIIWWRKGRQLACLQLRIANFHVDGFEVALAGAAHEVQCELHQAALNVASPGRSRHVPHY